MQLTQVGDRTDPRFVRGQIGFDVLIYGDFEGTIAVEASKDGETNWVPLDNYTSTGVFTGESKSNWFIRCTLAVLVSGTPNVEVY